MSECRLMVSLKKKKCEEDPETRFWILITRGETLQNENFITFTEVTSQKPTFRKLDVGARYKKGFRGGRHVTISECRSGANKTVIESMYPFAFGAFEETGKRKTLVYFWEHGTKLTYKDTGKYDKEIMPNDVIFSKTPRSFESAVVSNFVVSIFDKDEIWCFGISSKDTRYWRKLNILPYPSKKEETIYVTSIQGYKFSVLYKGRDDMLHCIFYSLYDRTLVLEEETVWSSSNVGIFCLETVSLMSSDYDKQLSELKMGVRVRVKNRIGRKIITTVVDNNFETDRCYTVVNGKQPHCEDSEYILKYAGLTSEAHPNECIHEGWVHLLKEVVENHKIELWKWDNVVYENPKPFLSMTPTFIGIIKEVFKGLIFLQKQGYEVKKENFESMHIVFTDSDLLSPKIIDCLVKTSIGGNGFVNYEALSGLIDSLDKFWLEDQQNDGNWQPGVNDYIGESFKNMLKMKGVSSEWFENLLYHPLFMTFEERIEYLERIRDYIRAGGKFHCEIGDVLGPDFSDWRGILYQDEILTEQFERDYGYTDGDGIFHRGRIGQWTTEENNVRVLMIFLRNAYKHWNDHCSTMINREYSGSHLSEAVPRFLPEVFKDLGHLYFEEKTDIPKSIIYPPTKAKRDMADVHQDVKKWRRQIRLGSSS